MRKTLKNSAFILCLLFVFHWINIHYDTRRLALRKEGIVLQLREQQASWAQTVERQAVSECGLVNRTVWATPYPNHFDFSGVADARLRDWLERDKIAVNLIPLFETSYSRTSWQLEPAEGVKIGVILDRGWIAANGRRAPLSEISLELVSGTTDDLYTLAGKLAERIQLTPLLVSRSERGYGLFLNTRPRAITARSVAINAESRPLEAFRALAMSCLRDMHLNHSGAISSDDPEYVHQMRVAIRRLRAALRIFKPVLPDDFVDRVVPRMRELINTLGRARDLDVLTAEIVAPVVAALPAEPCLADISSVLTERLYRARIDAVQALSEPGYGQQLLTFGGLLQQAPFMVATTNNETLAKADSVRPFAQQRLQRSLRKTLALAAKARVGNPTSLHQLRLGIKHLRYGVEFFGSLMPEKSARATVKRLATLQDELGQLNDLANAGNTLMTCAAGNPNLRQAVTLIADWHGQRHEALLAKIADRLKQFKKLRLKH
jgi:adenylate cyclase